MVDIGQEEDFTLEVIQPADFGLVDTLDREGVGMCGAVDAFAYDAVVALADHGGENVVIVGDVGEDTGHGTEILDAFGGGCV